jgi:hypothetical protein
MPARSLLFACALRAGVGKPSRRNLRAAGLAVNDYGNLTVRRLGGDAFTGVVLAGGRWQQRFCRWSGGRGGDFGLIGAVPCLRRRWVEAVRQRSEIRSVQRADALIELSRISLDT